MNDIINKIQEHNANRKLQILKGFVEVEDVLEKAVYSDNSQNRKLQRVGKTYGGKKEDEKSDKKDIVDRSSEHKNTPKADNQKVDYTDKDNIEQMKVHAKDTETDDLKSFLESADPNDEDDAQLIKYATKELKSRGELSNKKEDEKSEDEDEETSKFETGEEIDTEDGAGFISDIYANKDGLFIEVSYDSGKVKHYTESELDDSINQTKNKNLETKVKKLDNAINDLKKHLAPKDDKDSYENKQLADQKKRQSGNKSTNWKR